MELSSKLQYALLALLELSDRPPNAEPLKVCEIAAAQSIPRRYLDQIVFSLRRSGIVQGQRGVKGGYLLAKEPQQITLLEIMTAIEGEANSPQEGVDIPLTIEKKGVNIAWQQISQAFQVVLDCYTLQDLRLQRDTNQLVPFTRGPCPLNRGPCPHC